MHDLAVAPDHLIDRDLANEFLFIYTTFAFTCCLLVTGVNPSFMPIAEKRLFPGWSGDAGDISKQSKGA